MTGTEALFCAVCAAAIGLLLDAAGAFEAFGHRGAVLLQLLGVLVVMLLVLRGRS